MIAAETAASALRESLLAGRNADGGWGYSAHKASRLEPTCWALLALRAVDPGILTAWPSEDGLLRERRDAAGTNFAFHALGMLTLAARGLEHQVGNGTLAARLENARGIRLGESQINRQNNKLQGWAWVSGTFSWVEPTAWALLALRKHEESGGRADAAKLREAEALLADRCCATGGWNYGNSNMLGKELRPYVPTTALALLALQERPIPEVTRSLAYLERAAPSESSSLALSLASIGLRAHGRSDDTLRARLTAQSSRTIGLAQHLGMAMALYTLETQDRHAFVL